MDRLHAGSLGRRDNLVPDEIAFARRRRPDMHRFIRLPHMQRLGIRIGIDRDRADAHLPRRPNDPARNFAAIGDEERLDHGHHILNTPKDAFSGTGALSVAAKASPSTSRVCAGSITPSSHRRAVA